MILKCGSRSGLLYVACALLLIYFYKNVSKKVVIIGILAIVELVVYFFKDNIFGYEMLGSYVHNIYIEILFQFGIISILFLAYGTYQVAKIIVYAKRNTKLKKIVIVFFSVAILQLMISSSYVIAGSFGFILGIYGLYRKKKAI